jgi:hypothetical protein
LGYAVGREYLEAETSFILTTGREFDPGESAIDGVLHAGGEDWERRGEKSAKVWWEATGEDMLRCSSASSVCMRERARAGRWVRSREEAESQLDTRVSGFENWHTSRASLPIGGSD